MTASNRRHSTGLQFLDSKLDGGIPAGTLVALTAPASTQSELLLYHVASVNPVRYVSTTSPDEAEVRGAIQRSAVGAPVDLEFVHARPGEFVEAPDQYLGELQSGSVVVVDPVDRLERVDREQYLSFVNGLKRRLRETDSVGLFHALTTEPVPDVRRLTLQRADYVLRVEQLVHSREIRTRLLVTKARGGRALSDPVPLKMGDRVRVDTSRRIA